MGGGNAISVSRGMSAGSVYPVAATVEVHQVVSSAFDRGRIRSRADEQGTTATVAERRSLMIT